GELEAERKAEREGRYRGGRRHQLGVLRAGGVVVELAELIVTPTPEGLEDGFERARVFGRGSRSHGSHAGERIEKKRVRVLQRDLHGVHHRRGGRPVRLVGGAHAVAELTERVVAPTQEIPRAEVGGARVRGARGDGADPRQVFHLDRIRAAGGGHAAVSELAELVATPAGDCPRRDQRAAEIAAQGQRPHLRDRGGHQTRWLL